MSLLLLQICIPAIKGLHVILAFPGMILVITEIPKVTADLDGQSTTPSIYGLSKHVSILFQLDISWQDFGCLVQLNQRGHQVPHLEKKGWRGFLDEEDLCEEVDATC